MDWKTPVVGVVLIVLLGVGGLVYRNVAERSGRPIACPTDTKICPDGTKEAAEGLSCTFPECPPPNVILADASIAFAIPVGFAPTAAFDPTVIAAYASTAASDSTSTLPTPVAIEIHRYPIAASSTALATIQATAINHASGAPVPSSSYTATNIADRQYTVVELGQFEGAVDTAYYLIREDRGDVLRFDALDYTTDWANPALNVSTLPAHAALLKLLGTLQAL